MEEELVAELVQEPLEDEGVVDLEEGLDVDEVAGTEVEDVGERVDSERQVEEAEQRVDVEVVRAEQESDVGVGNVEAVEAVYEAAVEDVALEDVAAEERKVATEGSSTAKTEGIEATTDVKAASVTEAAGIEAAGIEATGAEAASVKARVPLLLFDLSGSRSGESGESADEDGRELHFEECFWILKVLLSTARNVQNEVGERSVANNEHSCWVKC